MMQDIAMKLFICLLLISVGLISCQNDTTVMYHTGSFESVLDIATQKEKPIWMILGGGKNCRSCEQLIENMEKEGIFKKYQKDYIFYRCNVEEPDNLFLKYIFLMEAIPNTYIISPEGKICSYLSGQLQGKDVENLLLAAINNHPYTPARHSQFKSGPQKLLYLQNLLVSVCLRYRHMANDSLQLKSLIPDIEKSISLEPYFYNLYLAYRIHSQLGDSLQANEYAQRALQICPDGFQRIVYYPLICELENKMKNGNFSEEFAKIDFQCKTLNIGEADKGTYVFHFKNTGNIPLIIKHISTSCQCARPVWDRHPLLPGETGKIEIIYQTDVEKAANKTIWVQTNACNSIERLTLTTHFPTL